ncbi:MAG TPA: hypothetical protein VLZ81_06675 [Blastocatellia bacterium]|nr:hypothetical protein [Blastocatellia bacterium]
MYKAIRPVVVLALVAITLATIKPALGQQKSVQGASPEAVDALEFLKLFQIGMSYADVQAKLPKDLEQEIPAYNASDNVFMLVVGRSAADDWGAYFVFDTGDGSIRKPEHLIEMDCSATLAGRFEDFDSLVREVSGAYGTPAKLDSSVKEQTRSAGWRVPDDSVLTLEYTSLGDAARRQTCLVDFVIRRSRYRFNRPPARA